MGRLLGRGSSSNTHSRMRCEITGKRMNEKESLISVMCMYEFEKDERGPRMRTREIGLARSVLN